MEKYYFQPEDDGLLQISELQQTCEKDYIVVCIRRNKNFPLLYLKIRATSEKEANDIVQKQNLSVKVLRAYQSK
jgi:hypothetical protein